MINYEIVNSILRNENYINVKIKTDKNVKVKS